MNAASLEDWHSRLCDHFAGLRLQRDEALPGSPIFALEHGLSLDGELPRLQEAVRLAVQRPSLQPLFGLPFVVYATELGYGYLGDEYWPRFEAATPTWTSHGVDKPRRFIRRCFEEFASKYGGAQISGPWAHKFTNIAWPITHAVLPTDLQRHLARLLYDYRHALTSELLDDHHELGLRLAQRSHGTSARFGTFAENSGLLGLVAAALLVGEEETPLLTPEVLRRIVSDINMERQAGAWLLDARRAAVGVRRRGFLTRTSAAAEGSPTARRSFSPLEARLTLRRGRDGWKGYVVIPSHEILAQRFPDIRRPMGRTRYRVSGVAGVQAVGALMYDRGPLPLDEWPGPDGQSLLYVEDQTDERVIALLRDHCPMPPEPWLFRIVEPGLAVQSRMRSVRPEEEYILAGRGEPHLDGFEAHEVRLATAGVAAVGFATPETLDDVQIEALRAADLYVPSALSVRPAGLPPAYWDGEGHAEWIAGDSPMLAVTSSRRVARCVLTTDVDVKEVLWPDGSDTIFIQVAELPPGNHRLTIEFVDAQGAPIAEGSLSVVIREPADSATSSGLRQGIQLRCMPPGPTLNELWLGDSRVEASGPTGERVHFDLALSSFGGREVLGRVSFSSELPVTAERWTELLRSVRNRLEPTLGQAEEILLSASHPSLGSTEVRASRPFESLRWITGIDRDGPFARLVNHSAEPVSVYIRPADYPATADDVQLQEEAVVRPERGGLVVATCGDARATVVVAPRVRGGLEALRRLRVMPSLQTGPRTVPAVLQCVSLAIEWGGLANIADATAEQIQRRVLGAIAGRVGGLIGGSRWWDVERRLLIGDPPSSDLFVSGLGYGDGEMELAEAILGGTLTNHDDAEGADLHFALLIANGMPSIDRHLAFRLGRLARAMEQLNLDDALLEEAITTALKQPAVFRLARLAALCAPLGDTGGAT